MKIKMGPIEISDLSLDELYALLDRYAEGAELPGLPANANRDNKNQDEGGGGNGNGHPASHADRVVLEKLVRSGDAGVSTQDLGEILGKRGKAIRGGLHSWAGRVGLIQDDSIDPFDQCRADGTRRGVRLKASLLPVAEKILANM
jgi:hypothetical protein